jgi:hypothetical protein
VATNLWARFKRLLPDNPLIIVTVNSLNSDGTSTVVTFGGGVMRVLGTSVEVGKKAYIRAGAIVSEAPNLQHYEIEV